MYTIDTIIPFELLIDIDIGLLKLIQYQYRNKDFFNFGILDSNNIPALQDILTRRLEKNPISVIYKYEDDKETRDDFYNQFIEKEYSQILKYAPSTILTDLLQTVYISKDKVVNFTIYCHTDEEIEVLKSRNIKATRIIKVNKDEKINIHNYGSVYVKYIEDIDRFIPFEGKVIYIANYFVNAVPDKKTNELIVNPDLLNYVNNNEVQIFSMYSYKFNKLPKG